MIQKVIAVIKMSIIIIIIITIIRIRIRIIATKFMIEIMFYSIKFFKTNVF